MSNRPLAVITGASSGIGYELARICAVNGFDLVIAADEEAIQQAAAKLRRLGGSVETVQADLSVPEGVELLYATVKRLGRPVDALLANAGCGLGHAFLDQDFAKAKHVVDTNITGTIHLIHLIGNDMRHHGGKILITGSIAGLIPGSFQAVYNGTKAFLDNFSFALREELRGSGVTVTCLMPGATDTQFFRRAGMLDTPIGRAEKDDAREVAKAGFSAMMNGDGNVVTGWKNKLQAMLTAVVPAEALATMHRRKAKPMH